MGKNSSIAGESGQLLCDIVIRRRRHLCELGKNFCVYVMFFGIKKDILFLVARLTFSNFSEIFLVDRANVPSPGSVHSGL